METAGPARGPSQCQTQSSPLRGQRRRWAEEEGPTACHTAGPPPSSCAFLGKPALAPAGSPKSCDQRPLIGTTRKQAEQHRDPRWPRRSVGSERPPQTSWGNTEDTCTGFSRFFSPPLRARDGAAFRVTVEHSSWPATSGLPWRGSLCTGSRAHPRVHLLIFGDDK